MTLEQMLANLRARLNSATAQRTVATDALTALRSATELSVDDVVAARGVRDAADILVRSIEAEVTDIEREISERDAVDAAQRETAPNPAARADAGHQSRAIIGDEPTTYQRGGRNSYFRDLTLVNMQREGGREALQRLERSNQEVRALTTTDGAGGDFVPPLWLVDQFVALARPARVVADELAQMPMPAGTDTIALPTLATGTATALQATQNTPVQNTDATTSNVQASVNTIAGQQVVAVQLLEQSPVNMDDILLQDLALDYAIKADTFVISNNVANARGLLFVSGVNSVSLTGVTATSLYSAVANGVQLIHTNRFAPADKIFMHPRRWAFLLAAVDTQGRPLIVPNGSTFNALATQGGVVAQGPVGTLQGLPVYTDPTIPTNLGAGTNEDRIIIVRSTDSMVFEGTVRSEAFRETKADQLSVLLRVYNYIAIHASRLPKSISVLSGVGLVPPTFP